MRVEIVREGEPPTPTLVLYADDAADIEDLEFYLANNVEHCARFHFRFPVATMCYVVAMTFRSNWSPKDSKWTAALGAQELAK